MEQTIQDCQSEMWVPVMSKEDKRVCPIANLKQYFVMVLVSPQSPCFGFVNEHGELKALTYAQLDEQLKEWIHKTGRDESGFTLNCLHRGGTTHAFEMGIRPEFIQMMGDWASECFYRYLDIALDSRLHAAIKFAKYAFMCMNNTCKF